MARRVYAFREPGSLRRRGGRPAGQPRLLPAGREGTRVVTAALEKVQVALLAERLTQLLAEMRSRGADVPEEPPVDAVDRAPLEEPLVETFRVGTMAIVWDGDDDTVVVEAREITEDEGEEEAPEAEEAAAEDADENGDLMRVRLEPSRALAFAARALEVVAAGRPPCPSAASRSTPKGTSAPGATATLH